MNAILSYDYVADVVERRPPHREAHLALVHAAHGAGELLLAGPVGDPPTGAVLVFETADAAAAFAAKDPYVLAGLVTEHRVEPMNVVVR